MNNNEEEENEPILQKMMRIIIFSMIAFLIVTALVLPIFGTMGDYTVSVSNNGANITDVQEKYANQITVMDSGTMGLSWNSEGVFLTGQVSGTPVSHKILDKSNYMSGYPILVIHPAHGYLNTVVDYANGSYLKYISGDNSVTQTSGTQGFALGDQVYIQDPNGSLVMTKNGIYCTDPDDVVGFGYDDVFIWSSNGNAITIEKED